MLRWSQMGMACLTAGWVAVVLAGAGSAKAACEGCTSFDGGIEWGTTSINALTEASGIAASARNPGVVWTHNDGARERMYALSTNGVLLATFDLNHNVDDVEDIAVGPGSVAGLSYLYIGDIGGNAESSGVRGTVQIVRAPEPAVDPAWSNNPRSSELPGVESFQLVYPDNAFDAEALLVDPWTGDVVVVTKQGNSARVYQANVTETEDGGVVTMVLVQTIAFHSVSGGDIASQDGRILLRREDAAMVWTRCPGESVGTALGRIGQSAPVIGLPEEPNGEGVGFLRDGTGYVTISEGEDPPLYFFRALCPAAPVFALLPTSQSNFVGGAASFSALAVGYPPPVYQWRLNGQALAGATSHDLSLSSLGLEDGGTYEVIAANLHGSAAASATLTVRAMADLRITEVQSSPVGGGAAAADWWELTSFESQPVSLTGWRFNDNTGGLSDPFIIGSGRAIAPGESIVFVEGLSPAQFRSWWGLANVPTSVQIISYNGNGLGLGAGGDGIRLWNQSVTNPDLIAASVDFGSATDGVTFNYDPVTAQFGGLSRLGIHGVVRAAAGQDLGSPGRILALVVAPHITATWTNGTLRIAFEAAVGRRYSLVAGSGSLGSGVWIPIGEEQQALQDGVLYFDLAPAEPRAFYRLTVR